MLREEIFHLGVMIADVGRYPSHELELILAVWTLLSILSQQLHQLGLVEKQAPENEQEMTKEVTEDGVISTELSQDILGNPTKNADNDDNLEQNKSVK